MDALFPFEVTIHIDKTAALLAGADVYGQKTVAVTPAKLTLRQRQTLAAVKYRLSASELGCLITGLESVEELLDRAADVIYARQV